MAELSLLKLALRIDELERVIRHQGSRIRELEKNLPPPVNFAALFARVDKLEKQSDRKAEPAVIPILVGTFVVGLIVGGVAFVTGL